MKYKDSLTTQSSTYNEVECTLSSSLFYQLVIPKNNGLDFLRTPQLHFQMGSRLWWTSQHNKSVFYSQDQAADFSTSDTNTMRVFDLNIVLRVRFYKYSMRAHSKIIEWCLSSRLSHTWLNSFKVMCLHIHKKRSMYSGKKKTTAFQKLMASILFDCLCHLLWNCKQTHDSQCRKRTRPNKQ